MKSAITISLVPEARGGPFVFWDDLAAGVRQAAELGFDAVEIFPPAADAIEVSTLDSLLRTNQLRLAAVGTGAGWLKHKLSLTSPDAENRRQALAFIRGIIDLAGTFGAPAIIGSMQGRFSDEMPKPIALTMLREALGGLSLHAGKHGMPLLYEHLNRYETNLCNTVASAVELTAGLGNVKLLADLFHMNIEEANLADAILEGGSHIGHVHFADSNRRAAGLGHTDFVPIIAALRKIGYAGHLSAEIFPLPDTATAARQTIESFRKVG